MHREATILRGYTIAAAGRKVPRGADLHYSITQAMAIRFFRLSTTYDARTNAIIVTRYDRVGASVSKTNGVAPDYDLMREEMISTVSGMV